MAIELWTVQVLLALVFLAAGVQKVRGSEKILARLAGPPPVSRQLIGWIGAAEVLGAIGVVVPVAVGVLPWLTPVAAGGLTLIMILAVAYHILRREYPATLVPLILAGLAAF